MKSPLNTPTLASLLLAFTASLLLAADSPASFNVGLEWDPSPSPNIAIYRLYYGIPPSLTSSITIPYPLTNTVVSNLPPNSHFQFYVTAVNIHGLESLPSNIVDYHTPTPSTPPKPNTPTLK